MNNSWATNGSPEMGEKKIERKQWRTGWRGRREKWYEGRKKERVSLQPAELLWGPGQEASWNREAVNWLAAELAESSTRGG